MKSVVRVFSILIIILSLFLLCSIKGIVVYDKVIQNKIIDNIYVKQVEVDDSYLGYIYIPKYDVKRLIKDGTSKEILDASYVGRHRLSSDNYLILAGHNTTNVFGILHRLLIGDEVYINSVNVSRKFVVYNMFYANEYEMNYLYDRGDSDLLLITCTNNRGERLLVMLKEVL